MARCPDGHDSDADDYCSVCGLAIAGLEAVPTDPAPSPMTGSAGASLACPNCSEAHGRDDVFCENCGYDFITGSLPPTEPALTSGSATPAAPSGAPALVLAEVSISVDAEFHAHMDGDGVLTFPEPAPPATILPVTSSPVLVGRASPSRNIHPDIDIADDPAASGRHARLDRRPDGVWTVTDLGSTNGTFVDDDYTQLAANTATPIGEGTAVYVGAWTKLELTPTT